VSTHDQLRTLLQRYARAADERDMDTLATLFHPDAEIIGSRGAQTLSEWLTSMRAPRAFPASMHMMGEPLITHEDDSDHATMDTYAVVYQLGDAGADQGNLTMGVDYHDEVVLERSQWAFRRRTMTTRWMQ
jgi:SnoaL-like domain